MKSTLNTVSQDAIEHAFPALYKDKESSLVVLAKGERSGTVICEGTYWRIGHHTSSWSSFTDKTKWQRLPAGSSVTLTQD